MDASIKMQCEQQHAALRDLRSRGLLSEDLFYKGLVALAGEYMEGDESDIAVVILLGVPVSYYEDGKQLEHIQSDQMYAEMCLRLARGLAIRGYLHSDFILPTRARA